MLPGLDPVQSALLFLSRQAVEVLQPVYEPLLLLWRKISKLRIALQRLLLLRKRLIAMRAEPVAAVVLIGLWWTRYLPSQGIRCLRWTWNFARLSGREACRGLRMRLTF